MSQDTFIDQFFVDIDETLDQLIENAEMLEEVKPLQKEYVKEIQALEQIQDSLINRLVNLDELMEHDNVKPNNQKEIKEKVKRFSQLDPSILPHIGKRFNVEHNQLAVRNIRKRTKRV